MDPLGVLDKQKRNPSVIQLLGGLQWHGFVKLCICSSNAKKRYLAARETNVMNLWRKAELAILFGRTYPTAW